MKTLNITEQNKSFEEIKEIDENGIEFWRARQLFPLLGYSTWQAFDEVVLRAKKAAFNSGQITENHFSQLTKMVDVGSNAKRMIKDWKFDRYACYLIAQNGDSKIPQIAQAQTYFAVQTRRQEIFDKLPDAEKRLFIRGEVTSGNKKLFKTAKQAGVSNFGLFNDAGYKGLYGASLTDIEFKKGIKKGELLDRAGSTELAANLFRITQTDEKINKDKIKGDFEARKTHFMVGGKVRQTIKDIGGELPENLKSERHIKDIKKDMKILKQGSKLLLKSKKK
ncbi:MAG: DNA damage-inducible protein D [Candidatus Woesebacteria bacterium]|nr:DNA damage-inducible protein D [Candidatus Woesebacteria bacterium]